MHVLEAREPKQQQTNRTQNGAHHALYEAALWGRVPVMLSDHARVQTVKVWLGARCECRADADGDEDEAGELELEVVLLLEHWG